ncbi:TylF/MycF/NovP-related O-methyltransferase [Tateyamaria armeniaca]|uniref:TylF/MycF/NovP-related O-methyltransferase n=1 Tax=Tateyamaria armeniaca TaxID=2518930 RepID=A0ABW8UPX5_9RHOB
MKIGQNFAAFGTARAERRRARALFPKDPIGYADEKAARTAIAKVRDRTMIAYPALTSLWEMIRHCELNEIPGAFVECGVWKGGVGGFMALGNLAMSSRRRPIHLFDAYDDICEPDPEVDGERAVSEVEALSGRSRSTLSGKMEPLTGVYDSLGGAGDAEVVRRFVADDLGYGDQNTHIHKGWFQDTVPASDTGPIAILRLDGDWYESTKVCLENLYDRVVSGGFVIIDDYGTYEGCQKAVDQFIEELGHPVFLSFVTPDVRYFIKP